MDRKGRREGIRGEEERFEEGQVKRKKPFVKPEIRREEPLKEITLFTSVQNVEGASFFP